MVSDRGHIVASSPALGLSSPGSCALALAHGACRLFRVGPAPVQKPTWGRLLPVRHPLLLSHSALSWGMWGRGFVVPGVVPGGIGL